MKRFFIAIIFFFSLYTNAQIPPILDHIWTIEQIDTGTQIIPADQNPFGVPENYHITYSFTSNGID